MLDWFQPYVFGLDLSDSRTQSILMALCTISFWLFKGLGHMYSFLKKENSMNSSRHDVPQLVQNDIQSHTPTQGRGLQTQLSLIIPSTRTESPLERSKRSDKSLMEFMNKFFTRMKNNGITLRLIRKHTMEIRILKYREQDSHSGFQWRYRNNTSFFPQRFVTSKIWKLDELKMVEQKGKFEVWKQVNRSLYNTFFSNKKLHLRPVPIANDDNGGMSPSDGDDTPSSHFSMIQREKGSQEILCIDGVNDLFEFVQNLFKIEIKFVKSVDKGEKTKSKTYELYVTDIHSYQMVFKGLDFMLRRGQDINDLLQAKKKRMNKTYDGNDHRYNNNSNNNNNNNNNHGYGQFVETDDASEISNLTSSTFDTDMTAAGAPFRMDPGHILDSDSQSTSDGLVTPREVGGFIRPVSTNELGSSKSGNTSTFLTSIKTH